MDLLDRIYPVARDLLARVDGTLLAGGAPADHAIWPLLRRVGALPGAAVDEFSGVPAQPLAGAGDPLRSLAQRYDADQAAVPMPASWRGAAAEGYARSWSALSAHLSGDRDAMAGRLIDSASYLDDAAGWLTRGRRALAGTLAECLGCAQAVTLHAVPIGALHAAQAVTPHGAPAGAPTTDVVHAAAEVAIEVLSVLVEIIDDGQHVADRWSGRLDEVPYRPPVAPMTSATHRDLTLG